MAYLRTLAVAIALTATTGPVHAQEISPESLCDAGIGDFIGGIGRLACKAVTSETLTADDIVSSLAGPAEPHPFTNQPQDYVQSHSELPVAPIRSNLGLEEDPCAIPESLECEYARILSDLNNRYGDLDGGHTQ
ncbi:MAG: hypothetical protein AAFQ21_00610 [Pseudomonadota bacterium]